MLHGLLRTRISPFLLFHFLLCIWFDFLVSHRQNNLIPFQSINYGLRILATTNDDSFWNKKNKKYFPAVKKWTKSVLFALRSINNSIVHVIKKRFKRRSYGYGFVCQKMLKIIPKNWTNISNTTKISLKYLEKVAGIYEHMQAFMNLSRSCRHACIFVLISPAIQLRLTRKTVNQRTLFIYYFGLLKTSI